MLGGASIETIFISAARADRAIASKVRDVLAGAGCRVIMQQSHFSSRNFMQQMHAALASASRVVALLSHEYLISPYCAAEWQNTIAGDPLNTKGRLVLLRVTDVAPPGMLSALPYWDLVPVLHDPALLAEVILGVVRDGNARRAPVSGPYWRMPRTIVDAEITRPVANFVGHTHYVRAVETALWSQGRPVALFGLHGVGKTAVATEYARRNVRRYSVMWLIDASSEDGVVESFLRLGSELLPAFAGSTDRRAAAYYVSANIIAQFPDPVLLIFDRLEDDQLLGTWAAAKVVHAVITSQRSSWPKKIRTIAVEPWSPRIATMYLRRESNRADVTAAEATEIVQRLGCLPQLVKQAADYLRGARNVSARRYAERLSRVTILPGKASGLDAPPIPTFEPSVAQAEKEAPGAAAVLCFASFFAAGTIPEELFHQSNVTIPPGLRPQFVDVSEAVDLRSTLNDSVRTDEALAVLDRLSFMTFHAASRSFAMPRLVQEAARRYSGNDRDAWLRAALAVMNDAFPRTPIEALPECERLWAHAQNALDLLPAEAASLASSDLATRCGHYLLLTSRLSEAEVFFRRALVMDKLMYGEQHDDIITDLNNLGEVLRGRNRFGEAEQYYRRALVVSEAVHGPAHTGSAIVWNNLALLLNYTDRFAEAEAAYRTAIAIDEKSEGRGSDSVALTLANLAYTLLEAGRLDEAEDAARQAIDIYERANGPEHSSSANAVTTLAQILADAGRLSEAERLFRRSIAITERTYSTNHADLQRPLNGLALLLFETDRESEAEPLFRRALAFAHESYGAYHAESATILNNLALLLKDTGRVEEAESHFRRALEIDETTLGTNHTSVARDLTNLAGLLAKCKRRAEGEAYARRALSIVEGTLGSKHAQVPTMLNNLAEILRADRRFDEAEQLYERAIAIDEANGSENSASMAVHLNNLALVYIGREQYAEAEAFFLRSLSYCERAYGPNHSMIAMTLDNTASAMRAMSRFDEAKALEKRARAIRKRLEG